MLPDGAPDELLGKLGKHGLREISKKQKLKETFGNKSFNRVGVPDEPSQSDVPQGNFKTPKWLITDLGLPLPPDYRLGEEHWELTLCCGKHTRKVGLLELERLPSWQAYDNCNWHCVTGWSKLGLAFLGVPIDDLLRLLALPKDAESRWRFA